MALAQPEQTKSEVSRWLEKPTLHFINGKFVDSDESFDCLNPATNEVINKVALGGQAEVDQAAKAARAALEDGPWGRMSAKERGVYLRRIADLISGPWRDRLALVETIDVGKPIAETTHGLIDRVAANFQFFAEFAEHIEDKAFTNLPGYMFYTLREPLGVLGLITPWNFPLMLATWKIGPCLAAGNTCILKPAELTPLAGRQLAEIMQEADLPPGVFNVVQGFGPDSAGEFITTHPEVNGISFTGESGTGRAIMRAGAGNLKRLSFELGGKGATIVFADADFDLALDVAARSAFMNQGEVCLAGSRIFVEEAIYDKFVEKLVERAKSIRIGDPQDPNTQMGALVDKTHLEKVTYYIEVGHEEGARLVTGGKKPEGLPTHLQNGNFLEPTVFVDANYDLRICQEEIFGPVVTVTPFRTEEEVVEWSNSTAYGLSTSICTSNLQRAHRVARALHFGNIWINSWFVRDLRVPFGGMKQSGIGREGGIDAWNFYTEQKTVGLPVG